MKKRQLKKNQKKYLPILVDEMNLLTMTEEEQAKAWKDYLKFRERHGYCKSYRELKEFNKRKTSRLLFYRFPVGEKTSEALKELSNLARRKGKQQITVQALTDFKRTM